MRKFIRLLLQIERDRYFGAAFKNNGVITRVSADAIILLFLFHKREKDGDTILKFFNRSIYSVNTLFYNDSNEMEVNEMEKTFLQVRTNKSDKEKASDILESLGTNLSSVVNMLLKQIIMTKSIPFEVKIAPDYSTIEVIEEAQVGEENGSDEISPHCRRDAGSQFRVF